MSERPSDHIVIPSERTADRASEVMRIQIISDIHFEFHADAGASFVGSLDPQAVDVLVVAGDLAVGEGIGPALDLLCERYARAVVVYVHGNHEFYGCSRERVVAVTRAACGRHRNLRWLDAMLVEIEGVRFLGAPLWFARADTAPKMEMNDFLRIPKFESWVYTQNARAVEFLEHEIREGDVVVTHHLPAQACVSYEYVNSPLNPFFVCDLEPLILAKRPALWFFGHTHTSVDVMVGATRLVCNPFGYARVAENRVFRDHACMELR
jgi:predicted phosphodiesterase